MPEDIMQLAAEGRAEDLWYDMRRRALTSLYYFSKVVCNYDKLVPHFHMPLCLDIQNTVVERKRGYLWPRGHFKSTIIPKSYPHWRLCGGGLLESMPELLDLTPAELRAFYKTYPDKDPRNLRIGIVGETGEVAEKDLKDIKDRTVNNQLFQFLFPELLPEDIGKTKWTESEVVLPRSRSFDESSITCMGVGAKRTGFHYDILVYDDIIGLEAAKSPAIMESTLEWMRFAPGLLNDPEESEELIAGTRWKEGEADIYGWLMKNMPYVQGTGGVRSTGFKFSIMDCYDADMNPVFPERFSKATLDDIRKREGDYRFNCNYRNRPTPKGGSPLGAYKFYTVEKDGDGRPAIAVPEDDSGPVHINQMARVSFFDPSAGGRSGACENAVAIVGTDDQNRHFVIAVWSKNCKYSEAIEQWMVLNDRYVCWRNFYEQIGHQKEVEDIVLILQAHSSECQFCGATHRKLCPQGFTPPTRIDKTARVELYLEPVISQGRFYIRKEHVELARQLDIFPHGDLVDQADSVASAVKNSMPYRGIEEIMSERDEHEQRVAMTSPYTNQERQYGGYGCR